MYNTGGSQGQNTTALATLASGLADGLTGDSTASTAYAAQARKAAVENNYLTGDQITSWLTTYEKASTDEARKKLVDAASKADAVQQQKALNTQITKEHLTQQQDELIQLIQSPGCDANLPSMLGAAGGATAGYYVGKVTEWSGNKLLNPSSNGLKDMRSSTFPSLIYPPKVNPIPGIAGAAGGSAVSERAGYHLEKKVTGDNK